jgi:SAM-dependent methyltransferase
MTFDYDAELSRYQRRLWKAMDVRGDDQVLDIGCGEGLNTREAAKRAVAGSAVGVDISERMLAVARRLSEGLPNVRFVHADAEKERFPARTFSLAVSRFGTMFFTDPDAAFANVFHALQPGARLVQLVWQDRKHQEWEAVIRDALADGRPVSTGKAFSLADPGTLERVLTGAGFADVQVVDVHEPVYYGRDAGAARDAVCGLWAAQDLLADLDPAESERRLQRLHAVLGEHQTADGVWLDSRAWLVTAVRPS